jgi:hypothetical protein
VGLLRETPAIADVDTISAVHRSCGHRLLMTGADVIRPNGGCDLVSWTNPVTIGIYT